jgi:putative ABC transport system permease protein
MQRMFPEAKSPLGKNIVFDNMTLKIIGTLYTEDRWDRRSRALIFPITTYLTYVGGTDAKMSELRIKVESIKALEPVREKVYARLLSLHRGVSDFDIVLNEDKLEEMENTQRALNILLYVVAILALFTGGISIMNIMFATIGDRIREIGLRKALGAHKSDLFVQFLIEAVLLCFVGSIPGMLFGSIPTFLPKELLPMTPTLGSGDYLLSIGFTIFVGLMAGVFPALRAANMRPIEALQYV